MANTFRWYELRTTDPKAAADFYSKVVGWGTTDAGSPESPYAVLTTDKGGVAGVGLLSRTPDARPGWVGYVGVDDVDAQAADPQGAAFHIMSANP